MLRPRSVRSVRSCVGALYGTGNDTVGFCGIGLVWFPKPTQLYFKHAFYERFCHIDPQVGFVDYCREMYASMREVTTHFRECWLRGIDALPAVEKAAARLRESQQIEHILHGLMQIYEHDARISADLPEGFNAESVCRFVIENVMGGLHHRNGNCDVLFGLLERTLYANRTQ